MKYCYHVEPKSNPMSSANFSLQGINEQVKLHHKEANRQIQNLGLYVVQSRGVKRKEYCANLKES